MVLSINNKLVVCILGIFCFSCGSKHMQEPKLYPSPKGYNMNQYTIMPLPMELDEISGLNFYEKDTSIFAIVDDDGALYKIKKGKRIGVMKFAESADYEDIARIDSTLFILKSNGTIFRLNYARDTLQVEEFPFPQPKANEFEILYYDDRSAKVMLICKDCESDKKKALTTYTFDPISGTYSDSSFAISVTSIDSIMGKKKMKFKPSAAAINPKDSLLYIISSINKLIVVTDLQGKVKQAVPIDPKLFKQPEGMTFNSRGDMFISNEFAENGTAELMMFRYQAQ